MEQNEEDLPLHTYCSLLSFKRSSSGAREEIKGTVYSKNYESGTQRLKKCYGK